MYPLCGSFALSIELCTDSLQISIYSSQHIKLLFRLGKTEDMESGAKTLKKMGVSVSYDEALPQRWKLTKQQICQTFLSALVLLLCSVVQIAGQHKREQMESLFYRKRNGLIFEVRCNVVLVDIAISIDCSCCKCCCLVSNEITGYVG